MRDNLSHHIVFHKNIMEFSFKNFAEAGSGTIHIKDLTVICGPNNSGKTYINYAIYSILETFQNLFNFGLSDAQIKKVLEELKETGSSKIIFKKLEDRLKKLKVTGLRINGSQIKNFFQLPLSTFEKTEFYFKVEDLNITNKNAMYGEIFNELIEFKYVFEENNWIMKFSVDNKESISKILSTKYSYNLNYIKNKILNLIFNFHFSSIIPRIFAITSERTGISLFYKAYDFMNNEIIDSIESNTNFSKSKIKDMHSHHALPIGDNINILRFNENLAQINSMFTENVKKYDYLLSILSKILDDGYFESKNGLLNYSPSTKLKIKKPSIPLYAASSSVKSLFLFDLFVKHIAQPNSFLIIDEPELNLSAEKQVEMARLVARLVNSGIKILLTTHSDYFIREINNLVTMSFITDKSTRKEIMKEYDIHEKDILDKSKIGAYKTDTNGQVEAMRILDSGIVPTIWGDIIGHENLKTDTIHRAAGGF